MNPSQKPRSLCFTPRTPWGRYPQHRPGQNYLRASEDKQPDISPMEYLDRVGVPRSLSGQTTPERVEEIQDDSIRLPSYSVPRLEVADSTFSPKPPCTPPAKARWERGGAAPTAQQAQDQMKRLGGPEKAIEMPQKSSEEKIRVKPSGSKNGFGIGVDVPWHKLLPPDK